ncbi:DUF397 domain-containing protein [Parasphingorhabdus pacifica]
MSDLRDTYWFTSSYSSNAAACVEVAMTPQAVGVRDTKNRSGGTLNFDPERWVAFVNTLKS